MATRNANDPVFETVDVEVSSPSNGETTIYTLRELSAGEYDECLAIATNSETSDVDMVMMVKLMLNKSIDKPRLTDTQLSALPYKISRSLKRAVSQLHWAEEQEKTAEDAEAEGALEGAGPNP